MYMRPKHCHFISPFFKFFKLLYKLEERRRVKKANHYQHHHMSKHFFYSTACYSYQSNQGKGSLTTPIFL